MLPALAPPAALAARGFRQRRLLPRYTSVSSPTPRAGPGGDGGNTSFVKVLDRLAHDFRVQAQDLGYVCGFLSSR